jgi:hypothetical protein
MERKAAQYEYYDDLDDVKEVKLKADLKEFTASLEVAHAPSDDEEDKYDIVRAIGGDRNPSPLKMVAFKNVCVFQRHVQQDHEPVYIREYF